MPHQQFQPIISFHAHLPTKKMETRRAKSECQVRLEKRLHSFSSNIYKQFINISSHNADLESHLNQRIQKASKLRDTYHKERKAVAQAQIKHVKQVVAEQMRKREQQQREAENWTNQKIAIARKRRMEKLQATQDSCKRRNNVIGEKVLLKKEMERFNTLHQKRTLENSLLKATERRNLRTLEITGKLSRHQSLILKNHTRLRCLRRLQRWIYTEMSARKSVNELFHVSKAFDSVVKCWNQIKVSDFDQSMRLMRDKRHMEDAKAVSTALGSSEAAQDTLDKCKVSHHRVFFMAGMIAFHANDILAQNFCKELHFASKLVVSTAMQLNTSMQERNIQSADRSVLKKNVQKLRNLMQVYRNAFVAWKCKDAEYLISDVLSSYAQLYVMKLHAAHGDLDQKQRQSILTQIDIQLNALQKDLGAVLGPEKQSQLLYRVQMQAQDEYEHTLAQKRSEPLIHHGNPCADSKEGRLSVANCNIALIHELIVNPAFEVTPTTDSLSLEYRVGKAMRKAYWDTVNSDASHRIPIEPLKEFRTEFCAAVKYKLASDAVQHALSDTFLDSLEQGSLQLASTQLQDRTLAILDAFLAIEAPSRRAETLAFRNRVKQFSQSDNDACGKSIVEFVKFGMEKLEQFKLDSLNAHLRQLSTYVSSHKVEYERKFFEEKQRRGEIAYDQTKLWLWTEYKELSKDTTLDKDTFLDAQSELFKSFYVQCILSLVQGNERTIWPETFQFDMERFQLYQKSVLNIAIRAGIALLTKQYICDRHLTRAIESSFYESLDTKMKILLDTKPSDPKNIVLQASEELRCIAQTDSKHLTEHQFQLENLFRQSNPIRKLFMTRAITSLKESLMDFDALHPSLLEFREDLMQISEPLKRLCTHNRIVFSPLYISLLSQIIQDEQN